MGVFFFRFSFPYFPVSENPPTPAICRGSAPEEKWLCSAFGGPAACPIAICRMLSLGLSAAYSLAFQQHVLWPPAGRFP
jgi:hypothetical protein